MSRLQERIKYLEQNKAEISNNHNHEPDDSCLLCKAIQKKQAEIDASIKIMQKKLDEELECMKDVPVERMDLCKSICHNYGVNMEQLCPKLCALSDDEFANFNTTYNENDIDYQSMLVQYLIEN